MTRLAAWWLRTFRREFCFRCDRLTWRRHVHLDQSISDVLAGDRRA